MLLRSVALLHVVSSAAGQLYIDASLGCDSEGELVVNLEWVHEACAVEPFPDARTPVPSTISTQGCAAAARRVAADCGALLDSSPWFASRKMALDTAVASAANLPADDGSTRHIADPRCTSVHTCGAVLDDGFRQFPDVLTGQSRVLIDVGPSHGHLRLEFDHLTLDAKHNDNLRLFSDVDLNNQIMQILPQNLPLQVETVDLTGSQATLLLVSDGAGSRTSLGVTVTCVCEDSTTFADADGEGCAAYADRSGAKHQRCASLLPPTDAQARAACPLACGACNVDPCAASPCQNGGSCAHGDGETCTAVNMASRASEVHAECCDEPTEDCSSGQPASCNAGCAAVLVPYYQDCRAALVADDPEILSAVESAVQQCAVTPIYQCSCRKGWDGENCEVQILPTFAVSSGPCTTTADGSCFRSPNYPDEYGALEDCEIAVISGAGFARATTFATESSYDFVSVDAVEYSGSGGTLASSGVPISDTVAIAWHSDDSEQRGAVEICGQACDATSCGQHGHCGAAGTSCDCSDGWSGASCDVRTTGQTAARALTWCLDRFALIMPARHSAPLLLC